MTKTRGKTSAPTGGTLPALEASRPRATERTQLRHEVADTIRELIVAGHVRPGELLRLGPLAEQMDISITPVREALLLLAQDSWVVQEPNRGFRVSRIRRADIEDTYLVQAFVAGEAAARAAQRATPADVARLRAQDAAMRELDETLGRELEQANYGLHHAIYEIADSPRLNWFIVAASRFVPRQFWGTIPGWQDLNRAAHGPIIDAIERRDADAARALLSDHIIAAEALLLRHLDAIDFWS